MKKLCVFISVILIMLNIGVLSYAETIITMYAPDGRTVQIPLTQLGDYKRDGWYTSPFVTVYAPGGKSTRINQVEIEAYKSKGWFTEPVVMMYAPGGKTIEIGGEKVEEYKKVGWYTKPMVTLYAPDGRTLEVGGEKVEEYKKVGWYSKDGIDTLGDENLEWVLNQFDYVNAYQEFIKSKGENWQCCPPSDVPPFYETIVLGNGKFEDAYVIDIDNDNKPELVTLFSNEDYGRAIIYKCEDGNVYEHMSTAGYGGGSGSGWSSNILQKNSENCIYEYYYYKVYEPRILYYKGKYIENNNVTEFESEEFVNKSEWSVFKVNGDAVTEREFDDARSKMKIIEDYDKNTLINVDRYITARVDCKDRLKGQNLLKFSINSIMGKIKGATVTGNIQELIQAAFNIYKYGYYYEALQICDAVLNRDDITEQQKNEVNDIVTYCNNNLSSATQIKIDYIAELMMQEDYYSAFALIEECKKGICTAVQMSRLETMEKECKYKIYAYESELEENVTIYAKSGMDLYVRKKEVQGYLNSGVWFTTPQKNFSTMKKDAYEYVKNHISTYLYFPMEARYPSINNNEIMFYLDAQEGSQAVYVFEGWVDGKNFLGGYVRDYYTAWLRCNPYGFYDIEIEFYE